MRNTQRQIQTTKPRDDFLYQIWLASRLSSIQDRSSTKCRPGYVKTCIYQAADEVLGQIETQERGVMVKLWKRLWKTRQTVHKMDEDKNSGENYISSSFNNVVCSLRFESNSSPFHLSNRLYLNIAISFLGHPFF